MMKDSAMEEEEENEDFDIEYNYNVNTGTSHESVAINEFEKDDNSDSEGLTGLQLYTTTLITSIGGILSGYNLGIISPALPSIVHSLSLTPMQAESVVGILYLGGMLGAIISGPQCDHWGRKPTILFTSVVFAFGSLIIICSKGYAGILWGRFFTGVAIATSGVANVSYLTEMAPLKYRGSIVSVNELFICIGFFFAYYIGYDVTYSEEITAPTFMTQEKKEQIEYKYMFGVNTFWSILQFSVMAMYVPESQTWLDQRRHRQYMRAIDDDFVNESTLELRWYNYKSWAYWWSEGILTQTTPDPLNTAVNENNDEADHVDTDFQKSFASIQYKKHAFVVLTILAVSEQFCGHNVILNFIPELFAEILNFKEGDAATFVPAIYLGVIKVFVTLHVIWEVDTIGRRKLLLMGISFILLAYIFFFASFAHHSAPNIIESFAAENYYDQRHHLNNNSDNVRQKILLALGSCMLVIGYAVSFGPITHLLTSELFPSNIRGRALAFSTMLSFLAGYISSYTFLTGQNIFGAVAPFVSYFINTILCGIFIYVAVPETGGCVLENVGIGGSRRISDPNVHDRLESMWLWRYANTSGAKQDHISSLTQSLASYDDYNEVSRRDKMNNNDYNNKKGTHIDRTKQEIRNEIHEFERGESN